MTGTRFPAGPADLTLFSTPAFLGRVIVGPGGSFAVSVTIPADTPPGLHRLVVTGILGNVLAETTVIVTPAVTAPAPPIGAPPATVAPPFLAVTVPPVPLVPASTVPVSTLPATQMVAAGGRLSRTGTDTARPAVLALALVVMGLLLVGRTRQAATGGGPARSRQRPFGARARPLRPRPRRRYPWR